MTKLSTLWNNFWFQPVDAKRLSITRLVFYSSLFVLYSYQNNIAALTQWANIPDEFWVPISFFSFLNLRIRSPDVLFWIGAIWYVSLLFSALGLFTRLSVKVCFFLSLIVLGYENNFGKIHHGHHMAVLVMGVLAWSRCGDRYSLDSFLRPRFPKLFSQNLPTLSYEYFWPIRLAQATMCLVYLSTGYQKLRDSGLAWAFSDNLESIILSLGHPTGVWFAQTFGFLCPIFAAATLFGELLAPLALFNIRVAMIIVPDLFLFHLGARVLMGGAAAFTPWMLCFVVWIPFDKLIPERRFKIPALG